jgi:hypothetical protein
LTKNTARVAARANDDVADPEVVMSTRLTAADVTICACEEDLVAAITTIYAHHVLHGLASFEIEPPSEDDMRRHLDIVSRNYPYLVAECDREVVGYAYASPYRLRPAYRHLWYEDRFGYSIKPYLSSAAAIATFPTTATAVGVRRICGKLECCAPFGLDDLFGLLA